MSIHKVTNIFVGDGSALEADVNTLTAGKLGLFGQNQAILASAYSAGGASESITVSKTFADGTFKKSMAINFTFSDEEKTLTDKEIDGWMNRIMTTLEKDLQAEIRK